MTFIAGVRIHPGFFKESPRRDEPRVGAGPTGMRVKQMATSKPSNPKAKYAMPVIAVVAAIGSFAAGAAIATAAGATIGAMVVGGAMMIGGALTIVGTVTGNQNLTKWGNILSIVGGVGALGLGVAGALTDAAGATTDATAGLNPGDADQALANQTVAGGGAGATPPTPPASTGLLADGTPAPAPGAPVDASANPALASTPAAAPAPAATPATPSTGTPAPGAPSSFTAPAPSTSSAFTPSGTGAFDTNASAGVFDANGNPIANAGSPTGGFFDSAGKWIKANPEVARAGFNATGLLASSLIPKPLNALDRALAAKANNDAQIAAMKAGTAPGWWYGKAGG